MKGRRRSAVIAALFVTGACTPARREEELRVQPPIAQATVSSNSLYVRLTPGTPLDAVVRLPIRPLSPGMTLDEAVAVAGAPTSSRVDRRGAYYSFGPDALRVEVAHLQYRDSGPVDKWVISADPKDSAAAALLSPELAALLSRAGALGELTIHEQGRLRLTAFRAGIKGTQLHDLEWYSIQGIPGG